MSTSIRFTSLKELMADNINLSRYTISSHKDEDIMNIWCDSCGCINVGGGHIRLSTFIREAQSHERMVHG
jgi:hypothetical protein